MAVATYDHCDAGDNAVSRQQVRHAETFLSCEVLDDDRPGQGKHLPAQGPACLRGQRIAARPRNRLRLGVRLRRDGLLGHGHEKRPIVLPRRRRRFNSG